MPISLGEWVIDFWDKHIERCGGERERQQGGVAGADRPLECIVEPGDVLFVPHGWWHTVINVEEEGSDKSSSPCPPSVALTQNYVSLSNLPDCLRFLRTRKSQISGCRDREEAVDPDRFYEEFLERVREGVGEKRAEEARQRSETGWDCGAWGDGDEDGDVNSVTAKRRDSNKVETVTKMPSILSRAKGIVSERTGAETKEKTSQDAGFGFGFNFN